MRYKQFLKILIILLSFSYNLSAQWVRSNGTNGQRLSSIDFLLLDDTNLYAAGYNIYKSSDEGLHWKSIKSPQGSSNVFFLLLKGSDLFARFQDNRIFVTTDSGNSWNKADSGFTNSNITASAIYGNNLFFGTYDNGIYKTTDNGLSWHPMNIGLTNLYITSMAASDTNVFAGTFGSGVFISSNNGNNWTNVSSGLGNTNITALFYSDSYLFAGTEGGAFLSSDNGASWKPINSGLTENIKSFIKCGSFVFAVGDNYIFRSSDNGNNWSVVNIPWDNSSPIISLVSRSTKLYAALQNGILYTSNNFGSSWDLTTSYNTLAGSKINSLFSINNLLFAGSDQIYRSTDQGYSWKSADLHINGRVNCFLEMDSCLFAGLSSTYGMAVSTNYGQNWSFLNLLYVGVNSLAGNRSKIYLGSYSVRSSTDKGLSWNNISGDFFSQDDISALYCLGDTLLACNNTGFYLTTNDGISWERRDSGVRYDNTGVNSLVRIGNIFFRAGSGGVHKSTDLRAWIYSGKGLPKTVVNTLFAYENNLFAGTKDGHIFISTDLGNNWLSISEGLILNSEFPFICSLAFNGGYIFAGTYTDGLYKRSLSEILNKIKEFPDVPVLVTPVNGALNQSITPTLDWNDDSKAATYGLQIAADSLFANIVQEDSGLTVSQKVISTPLTNNTKYYWRVNAKNTFAKSNWSTVNRFTTTIEVPVLVTPVNGALNQSITPTLDWNDDSKTSTYGLQIAADSLFANIVQEDSGLTVSQKIISTPLAINTKYFWRVNSKNTLGKSNWSVFYNFKTIMTVPEFKLEQNFPNPFNPSTNIKFSIPHKAFVSLRIYNLMGEIVAEPVAREFDQGEHTFEWNASGFSSGVYFYKISAAEFSETKKLMLVR